MATGTVCYWNGSSGWIKQSGVEHMSTAESNDVCLRIDDVVEGTIENGTAVEFTLDRARWIAREVKVAGSVAPLPPDSPPPIGDSPPL